jgi:AcrR family transcriptional regulator
MARVVKKHEVRKKEFLDTAQELFFSRGYEQTSVETIIKKIGLSKGSFYYYFKSKEDLLDQLTIRVSERILREIQKVTQKKDLNATEKLNQAYQVVGNIKLKNMALMKVLLETLDKKNIFFNTKLLPIVQN